MGEWGTTAEVGGGRERKKEIERLRPGERKGEDKKEEQTRIDLAEKERWRW